MIKVQEYKRRESIMRKSDSNFKQVSNILSAGAAGPSLVRVAQNNRNPRLLTDM
jgi:hypothetical protein